jgi:hypothetical protein
LAVLTTSSKIIAVPTITRLALNAIRTDRIMSTIIPGMVNLVSLIKKPRTKTINDPAQAKLAKNRAETIRS